MKTKDEYENLEMEIVWLFEEIVRTSPCFTGGDEDDLEWDET